jgi:hypothetical protein
VFTIYTIDVNRVNKPATEGSLIVVVLERDKEMQYLRVTAGNWKYHTASGKVAVMLRRMAEAASP